VVSVLDKDKMLPFRRSKLTYLMRDAIGGNCRTVCQANVWPEPRNNGETISTFQFARELGKVRNEANMNTMEPSS
jgi:kinesin family protein 6/9